MGFQLKLHRKVSGKGRPSLAASFTGNIKEGSNVLSNLAGSLDTSDLFVGKEVTNAVLPTGTTITKIESIDVVQLSAVATADSVAGTFDVVLFEYGNLAIDGESIYIYDEDGSEIHDINMVTSRLVGDLLGSIPVIISGGDLTPGGIGELSISPLIGYVRPTIDGAVQPTRVRRIETIQVDLTGITNPDADYNVIVRWINTAPYYEVIVTASVVAIDGTEILLGTIQSIADNFTVNAVDPNDPATKTNTYPLQINGNVITLPDDYYMQFGDSGVTDPVEDSDMVPKKWAEDRLTPVGSIVPYLPGYFADGLNGTYTGVALTLPDNWRICDGSSPLVAASPIFNVAGRYLPNLTDDRFLMGSNTGIGDIGGTNSAAHSHTVPPHHHDGTTAGINDGGLGTHTHNFNAYETPGGTSLSKVHGAVASTITTGPPSSIAHEHSFTTSGGGILVSGSNLVTNDSIVTDNRPKFLTTKYITRIF